MATIEFTSSLRRVIVGCLALALVLTGLSAPSAGAADKATVTGTGTGVSQRFRVDPGIYQLDFSFSGTPKDVVEAYVVSEDLGDLTMATLDLASSGSSRRYVPSNGEELWIDVEAAAGVTWTAALTRATFPTTVTNSLSATGRGMNASNLVLLESGMYSYTASYSGNTSAGKPLSIGILVMGAEGAHALVNEQQSASGKTTGTFTLEQRGIVWVDPLALPASTWTVDATYQGLPALRTTPTPTISGTVAVGQKLTAVPGTWDAGVKLSYQWLRNGTAISGATASTYTVATADKGTQLSVAVTGTKQGFLSATKTSAPTKAVDGPRLSATPTPTISGTAKVGSTLTAKAGTWDSGVKLSYQWLRNGTKISGATKSTYTATASDKGAALTVTVTGTKSGYPTVAKTSAKTKAVAAGTLSSTPTPTISGSAKVGKKLTAKPGTWKPSGVSLSYQWLRDGKAIKGATKSTYTVTTSDKGKKLSVQVKGSKSGYTTVTRTSAKTATV
ncbi:MAG: hypothetical protein QM713_10610 [Arachnia sp.]